MRKPKDQNYHKRYYQEHKEQFREYSRKRRNKYRSKVREEKRLDYHKNKDRRRLGRYKISSKYFRAQNTAKQRHLLWDISRIDYEKLAQLPCHYCKQVFISIGSGLDRLDSSLGYTLSNVVPCCKRCNLMKNKFLTSDEMLLIWQRRHYNAK